MEDNIKKLIVEWTKPPYDKETIREIADLLDSSNESELLERFHSRLEFGTGGLRGIIGAGTNRMNVYTVGMATQGLSNYIKETRKELNGVVIARDSRRMSDEFAREAASILAGNGIRVFYFNDITPTPFASYAIRELNAVSGIVITASHNPSEYNGYKVYWEDGGQIVPPHDKNIIERVNAVSSIEMIKKTAFDKAVNSGIIKIIDREITDSYLKRLEKASFRTKGKSNLKIAYSPIHGTGYRIVPEMFKSFGFENIFIVEQQSVPDGNFPTVKYPNPEERETMEAVISLAAKKDADLLLATDPDADRMGVGFKDSNGKYILINGNQIGCMLEYYILNRLKESSRMPSEPAVVKTIVTSDLQKEIAMDFGCRIDDVLTGFKWIASRMKKYDEDGSPEFIFGGEESYGYLPVDFVRDKDAVSSCYFFAEMADWLDARGSSLSRFLDEIYLKYSLYLESLHSLTLKGIDGNEKIVGIMKKFRDNPPGEFSGIKVGKIWDLKSLISIDMTTGKSEPISGLPPSDVLQFFLIDGSKITLRPSGTEPKIKFYFSVRDKARPENLPEGKEGIKIKLEEFKNDLLKKIG
ncbi:MAG: phospho-sugar mutase [Spirochaetes bacterium]|nr:phospho-sugar mutase [Spirochaetota bacterium]